MFSWIWEWKEEQNGSENQSKDMVTSILGSLDTSEGHKFNLTLLLVTLASGTPVAREGIR